jgi:hypothetical protein
MDTLVSLTDQERAGLERPPQARRKIAMPVLFDPSKQLSREEMKLQMEQHEKTIKRPELKVSWQLLALQAFQTRHKRFCVIVVELVVWYYENRYQSA